MPKKVEKEKTEVKEKKKKEKLAKTKKSPKKKNVEKVEKEEKVVENRRRLSRPYVGFNSRLIANIIIIILLIIGLIYSITKSFYITENETISYRENSKINYKVYLKENDFYNTPYLNKGMAYIASLIDDINISYNYVFYSNKTNSLDISHKAVAKLVIASQSNDKVFFEEEYELAGEEVEKLVDKNEYILDEEVTIDYDYYNSLANKFKTKYAVATNSYLEVYLQVSQVKGNKKNNVINESRTVLTIPLSHQEINIGLKEKTVDEKKNIISEEKILVEDKDYLYVSLVLAILILISVIRLINKFKLINGKKSKYDIFVERILNGYDRIIVNVKTAPNLDAYNVIKVESIQELIDVRDNVKQPIQYLIITEHQKCEFFVTNNNDLYLYVVKEIDIEEK